MHYLSYFRGALLLSMLPVTAPVTQAEQSVSHAALNIAVRSTVDQPFKGWRKAKIREHGKIYRIAALDQAPSDANLVRPVDQPGLLLSLREILQQRGYREAIPDESPEIVLTVLYGRGALSNPYATDMVDGPPMSESGLAGMHVTTYLGAMPVQLAKSREFDFEAKLQQASLEKLFIRISAWALPQQGREKTGKKSAKATLLWATTMNIDYPDQMDLNQVHRAMLAAGAPYFDRKMEQEQTYVSATMHEGQVILAPLTFSGAKAELHDSRPLLISSPSSP